MRIGVKESDIQAQITDALTYAGFTVYHSSAFRQKGASGVAKGIPDLLVAVPGLSGCYVGLEVKKPGKIRWSSKEQETAHYLGHFYVVQSLEDVLEALKMFNGALTGFPGANLSYCIGRFAQIAGVGK